MTHNSNAIEIREGIVLQVVSDRSVLNEGTDKAERRPGLKDAVKFQHVGMIKAVPNCCFLASALGI